MNEKMEEAFNKIWEQLKGESLDFIFEYLTKLLCHVAEVEAYYKLEDLQDERALLEVTIETMAILYCIFTGKDYKTIDYIEIKENIKLMDWLINLKFEKYGSEILEGYGLKIVGKTGKDYIVIDENTYN